MILEMIQKARIRNALRAWPCVYFDSEGGVVASSRGASLIIEDDQVVQVRAGASQMMLRYQVSDLPGYTPLWVKEHLAELLQLRELYGRALERCSMAIERGIRYIGFRRHGSGYDMILAQNNQLPGSARLDLDAESWASNVLYRMAEERCIHWRPEQVDAFHERVVLGA